MRVIVFVLVASLIAAEKKDEPDPKPESKSVWDYIVGNGPKFCKCLCGRPNPDTTSRMLGGQYLSAHEYPWLVLINLQSETAIGGVLLNDRYVITSANQLLGLTAYDVKVTVGKYDRCFADVTSSNHSVDSIKLHPDFDPLTRANDIALIRLSNIVVMDRFVSPICLPTPGEHYIGQVASIVGWGEGPTEDGDNINTCRPRKIGLPILSDRECLLGQTVAGSYTKDKGCAGVLGSQSLVCTADSGGPVQYRNSDGTFSIIGVLPDSNVCEEDNGPTTYTRVNAHFSWLFQYTKDSCYCGK